MTVSSSIRAVVFDLDGLMFNTEDIFELAGRELMSRRDRIMTDDVRHAMLGRRPHDAFEILREMMDLDEPVDDLLIETRDIFESLIDDHLAPMPGLFELLDHIDDRGLCKGVATSSPRRYMKEMLDRYSLFARFRLALGAEDVDKGKPHPEIYEKAAAGLGIATSEMLVLEDSEIGTRAAAASGAVIVSVPNRHTSRQDFSVARHVATGLEDPLIRDLLS